MKAGIKDDLLTDIVICKVVPADLDKLIHISTQTYFESFFEAFNNADEFEAYTTELFAPNRLSAEINDPDCCYYFAKCRGILLGYVKLNFNTAQTIVAGYDAVEIERIYILALYQNRQVGKVLLDKTVAIAADKHLKYIWLGVWENNPGAIRFYERHGFSKFNTNHYIVGNDSQTDFLMKLML